MIGAGLKLAVERLLTPMEFPENPHCVQLKPDEWENWLKVQCRTTNWRLKKRYVPKPKENTTRPPKYAWKNTYECDHAGSYRDRRDENLSPRKQRRREESIKCGCKAKIDISQAVGQDVVRVEYSWEHTGHNPASVKDMRSSRTPDEVRKWLDEKVELGFDQRAVKDMLRLTSEELAELTAETEKMPFRMRVSTKDIYNAVRRKYDQDTFLSANMMESVGLWVHKLHEKGWKILNEPTPGEETRNGFCVALCSKWQQELIAQFGDTVCLDSTHNTCVGNDGEKMFLYTIVGKDRTTGKGVPLAFMLTNLESHPPLKQFLLWMKQNCGLLPHTILIDCSDTEALAINEAYVENTPHILYCYWHLKRAWDKQIRNKIKLGRMASKEDVAEKLRDAMLSAISLLKAETPEEFEEKWIDFLADWDDHPAWVTYMRDEWVATKERWVKAWRRHAHYMIDTNNFIESWHSNLKRNYLGRMRRQRVDFMIRVLTEEVEPDYMQQHVRVGLGFERVHLCKAEREGRKKAEGLNLEEATARVRVVRDNMIEVDSFTKADVVYNVGVEDNGIVSCSCSAFTHSYLSCKHMFLSQRITAHNICSRKATLPPRQPLLPVDPNLQREDKRTLVGKILEGMAKVGMQEKWRFIDEDRGIDRLARSDLTRLADAVQSLQRLEADVLMGKLVHAPQEY